MEEKERYEMNDNDCLIDNEKNAIICDFCELTIFPDTVIKLLNQQDKRIKELKNSEDNFCECVSRLQKEIQQLKQSQKQLAIDELKKIRQFIILNDEYDEEVGCNIIETFDLLEDISDRIEKLGGGENE